MKNCTPGPFSVIHMKCADGTPNAGVKSDKTGVCVAWCHGASDAEMWANAERIAKLLNADEKQPVTL